MEMLLSFIWTTFIVGGVLYLLFKPSGSSCHYDGGSDYGRD